MFADDFVLANDGVRIKGVMIVALVRHRTALRQRRPFGHSIVFSRGEYAKVYQKHKIKYVTYKIKVKIRCLDTIFVLHLLFCNEMAVQDTAVY